MMWRILALCLLAVPIPMTADAQTRRQPMRFVEMDRNGDGVIARSEWTGGPRSFEVHDWNRDGVLSGDEVRPGARRQQREQDDEFDSADRDYEFTNWTARGFTDLDHNRDGRINGDEWHFDREGFRRADHDGDGSISRTEFLGEDAEDDDLDERLSDMDTNRDGTVTRAEWHGGNGTFRRLDTNRDGVLTRAEMRGSGPPPDLFSSVDINRDGQIERSEWHWSQGSFDRRDRNRDRRLSREEFGGAGRESSGAYRAGVERGRTEGLAAGREDRERNQGWDLEGQRELESADSGYASSVGPKPEYQAGYRDGFRQAYREGFGR